MSKKYSKGQDEIVELIWQETGVTKSIIIDVLKALPKALLQILKEGYAARIPSICVIKKAPYSKKATGRPPKATEALVITEEADFKFLPTDTFKNNVLK